MTTLIHLDKVRQIYADRTVLSVDDFHIKTGSIVGLAGPNGSGKSTLMRLLAFLEEPARGKVLFQNKGAGIKPSTVHRDITLLVQEPYLLKRSVYANVSYGLKVRGKNDIPTKVYRALEMVGLEPDIFCKRQWYELSGGECQRVALAARLVLKPKMLLMDEPTASLDVQSSTLIRQAALMSREEYGTTLVIVSHDMAWLKAVSDQIVHIENGHIINISQHDSEQ